jgi:hypothetical protein
VLERYIPDEHFVQLREPGRAAYWPEAQSEQSPNLVDAMVVEYFPVVQSTQFCALTIVEYFPAVQATHSPPLPEVPAGQDSRILKSCPASLELTEYPLHTRK